MNDREMKMQFWHAMHHALECLVAAQKRSNIDEEKGIVLLNVHLEYQNNYAQHVVSLGITLEPVVLLMSSIGQPEASKEKYSGPVILLGFSTGCNTKKIK